MLLGEWLRQRGDVGGDRAEVDLANLQIERSLVRASQCEQVVGQSLHASDLGSDIVEERSVGRERHGAVTVEQIMRRTQDRQRRAELVGGVGDELLLPL